MSPRSAIRQFIGRHRRSSGVQQLHRLARFFEDAYANVGAELTEQGELQLLNWLPNETFRIVFDVGANVGNWSMAALSKWPSAQIHAFEVAPETFRHLRRNLERDSLLPRAVLNPCGLADSSKPRSMFYYPDHQDLTCDRPRHREYASIEFYAQMMTGDEYMKRNGLEGIDFLKIDVEGTEYQVLEGFASTLASRKIKCIQFEYGAFAIDTRVLLRDFYALLQGQYWIGKLFPTGVEFRDYSWTDEDFRFANYLCVARDSPDLKQAAECLK